MDNFFRLKSILDENNVVNKIEEYTSEEDTTKCLIFEFPIARECEDVRIYESDHNIEGILNSNFLKYRGISNYEAIWSCELHTIESEVINNLPSRITLRRLSRFLNQEECSHTDNESEKEDIVSLVLYSNEQIKVSIGYSSKEFVILSTYKDRR